MKRIAILVPNQQQLDCVNKSLKELDINPTFHFSTPRNGFDGYIDFILYEENSNEPWPWTGNNLFFDKFGDGPYVYRQVHNTRSSWQDNLVPMGLVGTKEQLNNFEFSLWKNSVRTVEHPWALVSLIDKTEKVIECFKCKEKFVKPTKWIISVKDLPVNIFQCPDCGILIEDKNE